MVRLQYPGPISPTVAAVKASASPPTLLGDGVGRNHRQMSRRYSAAIKTRLDDKLSRLISGLWRHHLSRSENPRQVAHRGATPMVAEAVHSPTRRDADVPILTAVVERSSHSTPTDVNAPAQNSMPASSSFIDHAEMASRLIFGFDLRPIQRHVLSRIFDPANPRKRLIVQPTAIGKSHIIRMMGVLFKGIHLILHPLLALTGDQVLAFREGVDDYGHIEAHNLDQQASSSSVVLQSIIKRMRDMTCTTTTTMFLFASPQFLSNHPSFLKAIIECNKKHTFRSLSVDECHLVAQHGSSFRAEIRSLTQSFFSPIWGGKTIHPHFLALTATLSLSDLAMFTSITTVHFPPITHTRATEDGFKQEHIELKLKVSSDYVKHVDQTVTYLKDHDDSAYIFSNSKKLSFRLLESLEAKLNKEGIDDLDVMHIHGSLPKEHKFHVVNIFCQKVDVEGLNPRVLCATSAADLGISHPKANFVSVFEWPDCISTFVQRKGRGSRNGEDSTTLLIAGIGSYLNMIRRTHRQRDTKNDDGDDDDGKNGPTFGASFVTTPKKKQTKQQQQIRRGNRLSQTQRTNLMNNQLDNIHDMLDLFCLARECIQLRICRYLATGRLAKDVDTTYKCDNKCPMCSGMWFHDFKPINKEGLLKWFRDVEGFPMKATYDGLMETVWGKSHWILTIYDRAMSGIRKYNVEALFLSLIAAGLIAAEKNDMNELVWVICKESSNSPFRKRLYEIDSNLIGINFFKHGTSRENPLDEITFAKE